LAQKQEAFETLGIQLVGISYDSVDTLRTLSQAGWRGTKVRFPLLSDPESEIIKAFGVLNRQLYRRFAKGHRFHGVPHPHMFLVDPEGRIVAKFAEKGFLDRPDVDRALAVIKKMRKK
jgi:peroxiredoxin